MIEPMKLLRNLGLVLSLALLAGCESTDTANGGNQEAKRRAALQQEQQVQQPDETQRNLWNTQQDRMNRDGTPIGR